MPRKPKTSETRNEISKNHAVLDVVVPPENFDFTPYSQGRMGNIRPDPEVFKAGAKYRQILACTSYPSLNDVGWALPLFSKPYVITSICCEPYMSEKLRQDINRDAARNRMLMVRGGKESDQFDRQRALDNTYTMLEAREEDEKIFKTTIYQQVLANSLKELKEKTRDIKDSLAASASIRATTTSHNQRQAFLGASPLMVYDKTTIDQCAKPIPTSTLGASLVFTKSGIDDGKGLIVGHDDIGNLIRLDMMKTSSTRPNLNAVITGDSGSGKTTLMSKILIEMVAKGSLVIIIDPEREYRTLCENVCGQWVNLAGSSEYKISPLRPRATGAAADMHHDAEKIYVATQDGEVLTETVSVLRTFFSMAFGCSRSEIDYLEQIFKEEYQRFGITYSTPLRNIDLDRHPQMHDIYNAIDKKSRHATGKARQELDALKGKIWVAVEGSTSNLWSGKTNVYAQSNLIVLDTHDLQNKDFAIRSAQYFNLLTWVWDQIVRARITGRHVVFAIDESHVILGKGSEASAQQVGTIAKRIRKYNAGLLCATQQISDMDNEYASSVFNQACYRFLLATSAKNLEVQKRIFNLTDDAALRLERGQRGQGIIMAGSREKIWANVEVSPLESRYFTKKMTG